MYSASQLDMQVSYSLFSDDLKVIHLGPNYHWPPLSSCIYPILYAKIQPIVFDIEEIFMSRASQVHMRITFMVL